MMYIYPVKDASYLVCSLARVVIQLQLRALDCEGLKMIISLTLTRACGPCPASLSVTRPLMNTLDHVVSSSQVQTSRHWWVEQWMPWQPLPTTGSPLHIFPMGRSLDPGSDKFTKTEKLISNLKKLPTSPPPANLGCLNLRR